MKEIEQETIQLNEILKDIKEKSLITQTVNILPQIEDKIWDYFKNFHQQIENLKYLKIHAIKTFNDSIWVYKDKMQKLDIPIEDIDFEEMEYAVTQIPANLVAK